MSEVGVRGAAVVRMEKFSLIPQKTQEAVSLKSQADGRMNTQKPVGKQTSWAKGGVGYFKVIGLHWML